MLTQIQRKFPSVQHGTVRQSSAHSSPFAALAPELLPIPIQFNANVTDSIQCLKCICNSGLPEDKLAVTGARDVY